jgi:3-oxoacyl-[acyl-carrier-protein] synthase-3
VKHRVRIAGTGSYLPRRAVPNRELARRVGASANWIEDRTGIRSRFFASPSEKNSDLAAEAASRALRAARLPARAVDCILATTLSPDRYFPGIAVDVQARLGCRRVPAMDLACQCNGFLFGFAAASAFVSSGQFRRVLLVSSELHSRDLRFDRRSRDLSILFGDGAGAVVVEPAGPKGRSFAEFEMHSDGAFAGDLAYGRVPAGRRGPAPRPVMNKMSVIIHSSRSLEEAVSGILARNGKSPRDVDYLIPHQSNLRLIQELGRRLDLAPSKVVVNIASTGNTSSASIPIALDGAVRSGRVRRGALVVFTSFGPGYSWGSALVRF